MIPKNFPQRVNQRRIDALERMMKRGPDPAKGENGAKAFATNVRALRAKIKPDQSQVKTKISRKGHNAF